MKDWFFFEFFSDKPVIYKAAQKIDSDSLLKELKSLYKKNQIKREINNFYEVGTLKTTLLCTVLDHQEKQVLTAVRYLLLFGANPSLNIVFLSGEVCNAPIHEAARKDNFPAMVMLGLSGASIKETGVCGVSVYTLLLRRKHSVEEISFLTRLEQLRKEIEEGQKKVEKAKILQEDKINNVTRAYGNLIAIWKNCKNEDFLNQFSLEDKNCILTFIEDKVILLKYELYTFIKTQIQDPMLCTGELKEQMCDLLFIILEYNKIDELPVSREELASDYAHLITEKQHIITQQENAYGLDDNQVREKYYLRNRFRMENNKRLNEHDVHTNQPDPVVNRDVIYEKDETIVESERSSLIPK